LDSFSVPVLEQGCTGTGTLRGVFENKHDLLNYEKMVTARRKIIFFHDLFTGTLVS
jgi:hypothetical protein